HLLVGISLVQDHLGTIDDISLHLMRQNSFHGRALEELGNLGECGCHLGVGTSRADQTMSHLGTVVCSADYISGTTRRRLFGRLSNNHRCGSLGNEAINLNTQITANGKWVKMKI